MTINKNEYLICPCRVASIPYWKAKTITVPDDMSIVHQDDWNEIEYQELICKGWFLPPNTYDCGSFVVN